MRKKIAIECQSGRTGTGGTQCKCGCRWFRLLRRTDPNNVVTKVHKRKVRDQRCQEELYYPKQDGRACILCPQKDGQFIFLDKKNLQISGPKISYNDNWTRTVQDNTSVFFFGPRVSYLISRKSILLRHKRFPVAKFIHSTEDQ